MLLALLIVLSLLFIHLQPGQSTKAEQNITIPESTRRFKRRVEYNFPQVYQDIYVDKGFDCQNV